MTACVWMGWQANSAPVTKPISRDQGATLEARSRGVANVTTTSAKTRSALATWIATFTAWYPATSTPPAARFSAKVR